MISPELVRRYPFFGGLDDAQLKAIAMLADEVDFPTGATLFENDQAAAALYLLLTGNVELSYVVTDRMDPGLRKEFYVSDINPGEIIGISALVEPHRYTSTARVVSPSCVLKMDAVALRALCDANSQMAANLMRQIARVAMERLHDTRIQLVAARLEQQGA
jgi:CRP/FNR family cyclic AMP-dependent transcriptional regulator